MDDSPLHIHHHHHTSDKSHRRTILLLLPSLAFALTLAVLYHYTIQKAEPNTHQVQSAEQEMRVVKVGETTVNAFIPKTREEHAKGLGERDTLNETDGMLFQISQGINPTAFWMKGMRFPLDFIWIKDGVVTQIHTNIPVPEPNTDDRQLPLIIPNDRVDAVLEVNAGFVKSHDIKVGDPVSY